MIRNKPSKAIKMYQKWLFFLHIIKTAKSVILFSLKQHKLTESSITIRKINSHKIHHSI